MKRLIKYTLLILLVAMLLPASIVAGVPPIAQTFYGSVTLDGSPAPDGTVVSATMNGRTFSVTASGGQYAYLTIQTIEGDQAGDTISFSVGGNSAGSTTLNPGGVTQRNLSATSPLPQRSLTMNVEGQGSTNPSGTRSYDHGTSVTIRATPSNGWRFDHWIGDVASANSATTTVTMNADKTVTAVFVRIPTFSLTIIANGEGTVSPAPGTYEHPENTTVNLSATPADGWRFVNWSGPVADPNSATTSVIMDGNKTVTANFAPRDSFSLTIDIEGQGTTSPEEGTHNYARDQVVTVTANPASGYKFDHWVGDVADANAASTTITIDADKQITAVFVEIDYYTLTIEAEGNGSVQPEAGTHDYPEGETVNISATPAEGWRFAGWTGDVADPAAAQTTVVMTGNKTIKARFEEIPPAPVITEVDIVLVTTNEAVITWQVSKPVTSEISYWTGSEPRQQASTGSQYRDTHVIVLQGLEPGTTYNFVVSVSDDIGNELASQQYNFTTGHTDADISISGWDVSIEDLDEGKQVDISYTISNNGDLPGGQEVFLKVNSTLKESRNIILQPGASELISFSITLDKPGDYTIETIGFTLSLTVPEPPAPPVTTTTLPTTTPDGGNWFKNNWGMVLGISLGVILLIVIIILLLRRYYYIVSFLRR